MTTGLSVSRIVNIAVNLAPTAAQFANINSTLIMGDSDVIDTTSRIRSYNALADVATDFGTTAPEYIAAGLYFGQSPQPTQLFIGRWAKVATNGRLLGGTITAANQLLSGYTIFTNGAFSIQVDAAPSPVNVTGMNFSSASNLNAVATIISTALTAASVGAVCTWNAAYSRFEFKSNTTGITSNVLPLGLAGTGTEFSHKLAGKAADGAESVPGVAPETALSAVVALDQLATYWYGLTVAASAIADADHTAIAAYIEGAASPHEYGVSASVATLIDPLQTGDIASVLKGLGYLRTWVNYSSSALYSAASLFGRMMTVDFSGNDTTITMAFKLEPGIVPETLNAVQAATLDSKRVNYFVNYANGTAIVQNGWCSGLAYIDEIFGLDWLANNVQTNIYNVLYTSPKVPQTDPGMNMLVNAAEASCAQGRVNGLIAPGSWTATGFGALNTNDFMPTGFYVYAPPVATQAPADRAARKGTAMQIAVKLAGAIQSVNVTINVNR